MTRKQTLFVANYITDFNATRAALAAGYSKKTARTIGSHNLTKVDIQAAVGAALEARMARLQMSQDDVLHELALLSMSSVDNYIVDDNGNLSLKPGVHEDALRAVTSIDRTVSGGEDGSPKVHTKLTLWNKPAALTLLARHLGMLQDKLEVSGGITTDLAGKTTEELEAMLDESYRERQERKVAEAPPGE